MRLTETDRWYLQAACEMASPGERGESPASFVELLSGSVLALVRTIDAKDRYTRGHSERVAVMSRRLGEGLAERGIIEAALVPRIYLAGLLHDIGKIGIPEAVLCKNGPLSDDERRQIECHVTIGAGIVAEIRQMRDVVPGILCHHERPDGKGYPEGLAGEEIPMMGRIVMVADSFDAMTSRRAYREAMGIERALAEIQDKLGLQFDEQVGRVLLEGAPDPGF